MRELVAGNEHLFQQPDFIKENSKGVKELVAGNEHFFSSQSSSKKTEVEKEKHHTTKSGLINPQVSSCSLTQKGEHQNRMLVMLRKKALDNGLQDSNILKEEPTANVNSYFLVSYW